jgi:sulfatase modifying factor 1
MVANGGAGGAAGDGAGGRAGESGAGQSGSGALGGQGGSDGAGNGGTVSGRGGRAGGGAGGVSATGGEAGMPGGSSGAPSAECGDGDLVTSEACDDGNNASGDGCSSQCKVERGWVCTSVSPSHCTRPSCVGLQGSKCPGRDCCASPLVEGGTIIQGPDQEGGHESFESTVSSFRLDRFEVTVGRFRQFVNAYEDWLGSGQPVKDSGANPNVASGTGWDPTWPLPADAMKLKSSLSCTSNNTQTWSESGNTDTLPINCVNWYTAFAFCVWDGGRLPTESEFEYAAAGGENGYIYPWGDAPVPTNLPDYTSALAVYDCLGDNSGPDDCSSNDILDVGSKPDGEGVYGQDDLAGSMWEWEFDWKDTYPTKPQTDYAGPLSASSRSVRGGSWWVFGEPWLQRRSRSDNDPLAARYSDIGFRCARDP